MVIALARVERPTGQLILPAILFGIGVQFQQQAGVRQCAHVTRTCIIIEDIRAGAGGQGHFQGGVHVLSFHGNHLDGHIGMIRHISGSNIIHDRIVRILMPERDFDRFLCDGKIHCGDCHCQQQEKGKQFLHIGFLLQFMLKASSFAFMLLFALSCARGERQGGAITDRPAGFQDVFSEGIDQHPIPQCL